MTTPRPWPAMQACPFCASADVGLTEIEAGDNGRLLEAYCFCEHCKARGPTRKQIPAAIRRWNSAPRGLRALLTQVDPAKVEAAIAEIESRKNSRTGNDDYTNPFGYQRKSSRNRFLRPRAGQAGCREQ